MQNPAIFQSQLLNDLLENELLAGNAIAEQGPGWGKLTRLVLLQKPFSVSIDSLAAGLEYRLVNDPHYWLAEIEDTNTSEMLCCRFG